MMFKFLNGLDRDIQQTLLHQIRDLWTHTSTALEGNTLTLGDTKFVLDEGLTVSGKPIKVQNVHERCNLGARFRWGIEDSNHTEKRRGYCYEHAFSYHWEAMCAFHHLMRLAHLIQAIALATPRVAKRVKKMGIREFLNFVTETLAVFSLGKPCTQELN